MFVEKEMKNLLKILLLVIAYIFVFFAAMRFGVRIQKQQYIPPYQTFREQVKTLQQRVGCSKIDGVIGPETTRLVNQAVKAEEPNLFNEYAEKYMTISGAPR